MGKSLRNARAVPEPTTVMRAARTAAPSLPKSSAKTAKGSDDGSAIVAPAIDESTVFVGPLNLGG